MKKFFFLIITLFLTISCSAPYQQQTQNAYGFPSHEVLQRSLESTVALIKPINGSNRIFCTGVFISRTTILTAAHCVARVEYLQTPFGTLTIPIDESPIGQRQDILDYNYWHNHHDLRETHSFIISSYDEQRDLAILKYEGDDYYSDNFTSISSLDISIGQPLFTIGHPLGIEWNISTGFVSRDISNENGTWRLYSSVHIYRGNSGGPIFDINGNLVGICSQMGGEAPFLNKGIYFKSIIDHLRLYLRV